ncbi:MAG: hypothetical protein ACPGYV_11440, partial [Phycisphaeraceae bacterium]
EIDRLLRSGLEKELITRHKGPAFRRVSIKLAGGSDTRPTDPRRLPPEADHNPKLSPDRQPPSSASRAIEGDQ